LFSSIYKKDKVKLSKIIGLLIGLIGILAVFINKLDFKDLSVTNPILALASAMFFAVYTLIGRKVSVRMGSLKMNAYSFILGSLIMLPGLIVFKISPIAFSYKGLPQILFLSFFVTGIAYLTYFKGLAILGASNGSLVFFAKPVLASIIAIIFLKETLSIDLIVGTLLVLFGIAIVLRGEKVLKTKGGDKMLYELRIYHIYPGKMKDIHKRFSQITLELFKKHNMITLDFWEDAEGKEIIYYILEHPSRVARDKNFEDFQKDPEWIEGKRLSELDGPIVENVESIYMSRVPYSPYKG